MLKKNQVARIKKLANELAKAHFDFAFAGTYPPDKATVIRLTVVEAEYKLNQYLNFLLEK